jgi:1,4-dihydroxy-2-naphthoyl-CoA hydrolase
MQFDIHAVPFFRWLGATMTKATPAQLEAELTVEAHHCNLAPTMHGGALMAFADNMGGCGAILNLPDGKTTATIESKTNFIRPIKLGETIRAITTPVSIGQNIQIWKTEIMSANGKLAGIVTQTQIIMDKRDQT